MIWKGLPVLIFGSGGISKEVYCLIKDINSSYNQQVFDFRGFICSKDDEIGNRIIDDYRNVCSDNTLADYINEFPVIGMVIPIGTPNIKSIVYKKIKNIPNIVFPNIIHPSVKFDRKNIIMGEGNIFTAGTILTCDIEIGNFNLFNLNTTVGHDTKIGNFNVINPLVSISGNVNLMNSCLLGTGSKVLQGLTVKDNSTIGGGAVVVKDVAPDTTVVGIPAKKMIKRK